MTWRKMMQHRFRFVTLEGDIVNPGGSMTGGALKQKNDLPAFKENGIGGNSNKNLLPWKSKPISLKKQVKQLKVDVGVQEQTLEQTRKTGERLRLQEQTLKGELREVELQERNVNERLHLYDLDKKFIFRRTTAKKRQDLKSWKNFWNHVNRKLKGWTG
ncbi:hypothetical protein RCO48_10900 [Peribacillus frigoritolerans]|nr:hypothetical protein [Peribacillus frigoritolerans]